jgi:hypothetical protein
VPEKAGSFPERIVGGDRKFYAWIKFVLRNSEVNKISVTGKGESYSNLTFSI